MEKHLECAKAFGTRGVRYFASGITILITLFFALKNQESYEGIVYQKLTSLAGRRMLPEPSSSFDSHKAQCVCSTDGWFGRLGNRLISTAKMIRYAESRSCVVVIRPDMLPGWNPPLVSWAANDNWNSSYGALTKDATCKAAANEWYGAPEIYNNRSNRHLHILREYFNINQTHVLGKECPSTTHVAMHIRTGDITLGSWTSEGSYQPPGVPNMAPFPTSYYISVIKEVRARRGGAVKFFVFCETMTNPTCEYFEKLSATDDHIVLRVGQSLIDDLLLMLCAGETAAARGTFHTVFAVSVGLQVQHSFLDTAIAGTRCEGAGFHKGLGFMNFEAGVNPKFNIMHTIHWITSPAVAEKFLKDATEKWENSGYQRHEINAFFEMSHANLSC